jgi:hypothetical protein
MIRTLSIIIMILALPAIGRGSPSSPQFGYTSNGMVNLSVNNLGYIGNAFSNRQIPSCEFPPYSGGEHLYLGGLWVGALTSDGYYRVSTSAQDANGLVEGDARREYQPAITSQIPYSFRYITNEMNDTNYHPDALASDHFECVFKDNAVIESGNHTPLGIVVVLRALAWNSPLYDDFVILDYTITNDNTQTLRELRDIYVGLWLDTTVGNTYFTNPYDPNTPNPWNFNDDLNGAWRPGDFTTDPTLWMSHEHDADGDSGYAPSWIGCRLLGTTPQVAAPIGFPPVSYNSWRFRGVPDMDSWYVEQGDTTNTLLPGKYQVMSNGHFDVGVTPDGDFSQPSNWTGLLSTGPFPSLAAGESVRVVFAITLGQNGTQMRYNSRNAKLLFDSGYQPQVSAVQTPPSSRIALGPAIPNPFNPSTTLSFNISIPGPVLISVHDLNGRRIRVLLDENRQSGSHQVTWDGRDGSGRTVASGTYFVRLSSGGESSVAKVVLSK